MTIMAASKVVCRETGGAVGPHTRRVEAGY